MGIYIKGMEMPQNCCACFCSREDECGITHYKPTFNEWYEDGVKDCPLIPVSDHGRLIDADALVLPTNLNDWNSVVEYVHNITDCWKAIDNAPTVIPEEHLVKNTGKSRDSHEIEVGE